MKHRRTTLTVLMATYQGSRYVREQVRSLLGQRRPPDVLLVQDDGSTDDTLAQVERAAEGAPFRVEIHGGANVGWIRNFERGLRRVTTDLVAFCDQDDVWLPRKLELQSALLEARPEVSFTFSSAAIVDADLRPTGRTTLRPAEIAAFRERPFATIARYNVAQGASSMMRTGLRDALLPIPDHWSFDAWLALGAAALGGAEIVEEPLLLYRQHTTNTLGTMSGGLQGRLRLLARIRREGGDHVDKQLTKFIVARERLAVVAGAAPEALVTLDDKIAHLRRRTAISGRRSGRLLAVGRELVRGRYHEHGRGIWSAARDLIA